MSSPAIFAIYGKIGVDCEHSGTISTVHCWRYARYEQQTTKLSTTSNSNQHGINVIAHRPLYL